MPKAKTTCPRCGYEKAKPNARGPNCVYCKQCGGLVEIQSRDHEPQAYSDDPVQSAIANERRLQEVGVIRTPTPKRGGL